MDALQSGLSRLVGQTIIAAAMVALIALGGRLIYISASRGPALLAQAHHQQRSIIPLKHRRGLITDCRGRIIAGTLLQKSVFADPSVLPDKQAAAEKVAGILGLDAREVGEELLSAGDREFIVIRRGITEEQAQQIDDADVYGLGTFNEPYRTYPMGEVAAPLVGFVSPDGHGVSGLEIQCEQWLAGENGLKTIIRDARRKAFWLAENGYRPARDGFHVVLTIDAEIQATAERELAACIQQYKAESGCAIVMHPRTGAILAMANVPSFDPNRYRDYGASLYRNKAITDPFEPGSTFKPFVAAAALAEGVVKLGEVFDCESGSWQDGARLLHDHHPYGALTFEQVVIKSSNIGMAKFGKRLGNERMYKAVRAFGFGEKTGIGLDGEDPGLVRPFHRWNSFTTTSVPMGQEVGVTALQLARSFCAFANGGLVVQPFLIRAVLAADGRVLSDFSDPPPLGQAIPAEIAETMKEKVLCPVVEEGTGTKAKLANYRVFGKTGTAQIARHGGGGFEPKAYVGSFVCGAPATDPQLVVLVSIRRPNAAIAYYGGTIAAPTAKEILAHALAYLNVPPDKTPSAAGSAVTGVTGD
jgi:cell division protein FtsI/penicillin-binding protein 2